MVTTTTTKTVRCGLGGAGNFRQVTSDMPSRVSTPAISIHRISGIFTTGIGGFGNFHDVKDHPVISAEELAIREQIQRDNAPTMWSHGIGGAGNHCSRSNSISSSASDSSSERRPSTSSRLGVSNADKLRNRISASFESKGSRLSILEAWQSKSLSSASLLEDSMPLNKELN